MARPAEESFAGLPKVDVLVLRVEGESLVSCKVDALAEPDWLTVFVEFNSQHEDVRMLRELRRCWCRRQAQ